MKRPLFVFAVALLAHFNSYAQIPNPGFEQWDSMNFGPMSIFEPRGWMTGNAQALFGGGNSSVIQNSSAKTGAWAMEITNFEDTFTNRINAGYASSGKVDITSGMYNDKFPVTGKVTKLRGFYKYSYALADSLYIGISVYNKGVEIGYATYQSNTAANAYTPFSLTVTYSTDSLIPDSASILLRSGSETSPAMGSRFIVDDLSLEYAITPVGINDNRIIAAPLQPGVYPNPTAGILYLTNPQPDDIMVTAFNITGQAISEIMVKAYGENHMMLEEPGVYMLKVTDHAGRVSYHKVIKTVN